MSGQARRSNVWREFWKLDQPGLCFVLFLLIPLSPCLRHREDVLRSGYNHTRHKSNVSIFFLCGLQPKLAPGEHSLLLSVRPSPLTVTSPPSIYLHSDKCCIFLLISLSEARQRGNASTEKTPARRSPVLDLSQPLDILQLLAIHLFEYKRQKELARPLFGSEL